MGDQFITDMVSKIGGYLMDLTINELRPVFQFKSIVEDLKHKSDNLCSKQRTIQDKICRAKQNSEAINDDVRKWVSDVEDILKRVQNLEEKLRPNKRWLCGQCPNMIWRYHLGKDAMKEMAAIKMLQQEGDFGQVSHHTIVDVNIPSQETLFESTESAFDQIMEALKSDDCNMVGLYGIGGVGKTTLAQEVRARATELKLFDNIVMVVVSQNPNFSAIQDEIAERLGLKIEEKVKEARASRLSSRLKQEKKILIILDDVWGDLDLANDIGIPHGDDHKGCKILLTTRRLHVCKSMGSKKNIELAALKYEDARALFEKSADLTDKSPELNEIVKEVVRECKGLPLAIVAVGKALREKTLDEYKRALNQLKDARLDEIEDVDKEVYKSLMLSYDYLKSKQTKSCFLL
ncbi:NB-ARC domain-containing protein [Cephalotus follicularis]|uniref:NB-ARC domain-containing protein n=1 Tax=Cephalotus follicularis TaxID=3775 RepID=A0A1Q3BL71_CEPFO|nr:NB-ARC domain-containing protein [Cephalotus follicularis]